MNNSPTTSATTDTMAGTTTLPTNVYVSTHPCLEAKLSQLRAGSAPPREVKALVHEISLILGCEALASNLTSTNGPKVRKGDGYTCTCCWAAGELGG